MFWWENLNPQNSRAWLVSDPQDGHIPALNDQGYHVGRVERNLFWVTDGTYQSAFLATDEGVVLFDAPPTIGHNLQRAVDEIAATTRVSNPQPRVRARPN